MPIVSSKTMHPFDSHTDNLVEYYGVVNGDGSINIGCKGMIVTRVSTGLYRLDLVHSHAIFPEDFANMDNSPSAWGTGVTKTCQIFVNAIPDSISPSSPLYSPVIEEARGGGITTKDFAGKPIFVVYWEGAAPGSTLVAIDVKWCFKLVVSTSGNSNNINWSGGVRY